MLGARWLVGLVLMLATRLLLEDRLPSGAAMGLGFAVFMMLWLPTVPPDAYRPQSPRRKLLFFRFALFLVAAAVAAVLYDPAARWLERS
jgi:hypothetical protein